MYLLNFIFQKSIEVQYAPPWQYDDTRFGFKEFSYSAFPDIHSGTLELTLPRGLDRFLRELRGVVDVIFSAPLFSKIFGRHAVQGPVRPEGIVPDAPRLDRLPGFLQVPEVMRV